MQKNRYTRAVGLMAVGLGICAGASAEGALKLPDDDEGYLIGASLASLSSHVGTDTKSRFTLKPIWAFQLGRFRVSRSRANSLMSAGRERTETGVSANFDVLDDWRLGASLRVDNGRSFDSDPRLAGLPDVRTTLRARLSVSRPFGSSWNWNASIDQDILGRDGGLRMSQGVGYRWTVSEKTYWDFSLSSTLGNGRYLQTHYGISQQAAADTGRNPYLIGGGLESLRSSVQFTRAISRHWVAFGGLDLSHLLRDAGRSPLVGRGTSHSLSMGVAYRSK